MLLIFLVLFLVLMIVLWCISDNFKFAVLNIYVLGKLKSRIKEGFMKVIIMDIAFQKFKNEEELKQIKDVFITEINKINDDYKFFMDPIDDARKNAHGLSSFMKISSMLASRLMLNLKGNVTIWFLVTKIYLADESI